MTVSSTLKLRMSSRRMGVFCADAEIMMRFRDVQANVEFTRKVAEPPAERPPRRAFLARFASILCPSPVRLLALSVRVARASRLQHVIAVPGSRLPSGPTTCRSAARTSAISVRDAGSPRRWSPRSRARNGRSSSIHLTRRPNSRNSDGSIEPLHDSRSDIGIVLSKVSGAREGVALMKRERN
jgi:hypothetical protein